MSHSPTISDSRGPKVLNVRGHSTLLLLACGFGTVFLARNGLGYLAPFMEVDLGLTPQRLGLLASAFSLAWALSGSLVTASFRPTLRYGFLVGLLAGLGVACGLASMASGFAMFLIAWLAAGLCSGPMLPLTQSQVAHLGSQAHRGLRMGVVQGLGTSLFGAVAAPLLLVPIASVWNWRAGLLLIAGCAILSATTLAATLRAAAKSPNELTPLSDSAQTPALEPHQVRRNVALCCVISVMMIGWLILSTTFFPTYLVTTLHRSPAEMSGLMSLTGPGALTAAFLFSHLSDRFGRRSMMVLGSLLGVLGPAVLMCPNVPLTLIGAAIFAGSFASGTIPLFMAVIPADSVRPAKLAATIGLIQCVGEIGGGVVAPAIAGMFAEYFSKNAPLVMALAGATSTSVLSMAFIEPKTRLTVVRREIT